MSTNATATTTRSDARGLEDALAALKGGRPDEARAKLETVCQEQPEHAGAHTLLGISRYHQHDFGAAKEALRRALALDARQPEAFYHLGLVREATGDREGAKSSFASALSLNPGHTRAEEKLQSARPAGAQAGKRYTEIDVPQTDEDLRTYRKRLQGKKRADFWAENWHKYPLPLRIVRIVGPVLILVLVLGGMVFTLFTMNAMGGDGLQPRAPTAVLRER